MHAHRATAVSLHDSCTAATTGQGLVCHSDRGSQYAAEAYARQLTAMKATPSMSRTACC
ncbi:hypothetical protein [Sphingobium chungbukense]|uniref:hypothetical protein n=1 Tax=Sphingobium chungbukense TaxID=56193 RepID=UPI0038CD2BD4